MLGKYLRIIDFASGDLIMINSLSDDQVSIHHNYNTLVLNYHPDIRDVCVATLSQVLKDGNWGEVKVGYYQGMIYAITSGRTTTVASVIDPTSMGWKLS